MSVTVTDPLGAALDPELPSLALLLNPETARDQFKRHLPRLSGEGWLKLRAIRVIRHKPGRRCVVECDVRVLLPGKPRKSVTLIGKTRARRSGNEGFRLQEAFWNAGFEAASADGVSVPEPIGVIADFRTWFQRKASGRNAEELVGEAKGGVLAERVARAIHKLHRAGVAVDRQHTMADELRILRECLARLAEEKPAWSERLKRVARSCEALGGSFSPAARCGIHRDFYPAQVIVDGERLWLLDFDLYCEGDPGLDVGNFIGHIREQALRQTGDVFAMAGVEAALEDQFVALAGEATRASVRAYADLTLARHIYLSTRFPERSHLTERLLTLCEKRLGPHCA